MFSASHWESLLSSYSVHIKIGEKFLPWISIEETLKLYLIISLQYLSSKLYIILSCNVLPCSQGKPIYSCHTASRLEERAHDSGSPKSKSFTFAFSFRNIPAQDGLKHLLWSKFVLHNNLWKILVLERKITTGGGRGVGGSRKARSWKCRGSTGFAPGACVPLTSLPCPSPTSGEHHKWRT